MTTLDAGLATLRSAAGRVSSVWDAFARWLKSMMPTGLYGRALLIIIMPMVVLQSVVAFVFMERHWNTVTRRLSAAVTQDIAALIDIYGSFPQDPEKNALRRIALERLSLSVDFLPVIRNAAARAEAVLLAARPGAVAGDQPADPPAVLDRHGRALEPGRDPHPARRHGDARVRAAQRRLRVELGNLPVVDDRHVAGAARRRDRLPAQPDQADLAARGRRREFRQGARRARLPPARGARGAPRRARLHRDEAPRRAHDGAAHHRCWRASRTICAPS